MVIGLRLFAVPGWASFSIPFDWTVAANGPPPGRGFANRNFAALFCPEAPVPTPKPGADCPDPPEPAPELPLPLVPELPLPELEELELPEEELPDPELDDPLPEELPVLFPPLGGLELLVLAQLLRKRVDAMITNKARKCRAQDIDPPKTRYSGAALLDEHAETRLPLHRN